MERAAPAELQMVGDPGLRPFSVSRPRCASSVGSLSSSFSAPNLTARSLARARRPRQFSLGEKAMASACTRSSTRRPTILPSSVRSKCKKHAGGRPIRNAQPENAFRLARGLRMTTPSRKPGMKTSLVRRPYSHSRSDAQGKKVDAPARRLRGSLGTRAETPCLLSWRDAAPTAFSF